jgi:hypothetical protein
VAEGRRVGVLVPNLFLRVGVDTAVQASGAQVVALSGPAPVAAAGCAAVIADLDALGAEPAAAISALVATGATVLAFGPHVQGARLAAARAAGAVVFPRSVFLQRLPELLAMVFDPGREG